MALDHLYDPQAWMGLDRETRKARLAEVLAGRDRPALLACLTGYLLTYGRRGSETSLHTLRAYRRGAETLCQWAALAGLAIEALDEDAARRWMNWFRDLGRAVTTIRARVAAASALYRALAWCDCAESNPFLGLRVFDPTPAYERAERFTEAEVERLIDVAGRRDLVLVLLGADGGLRVSETAHLEWSAVDLAGKRLQVVSGKGGKTRTIALTDRLAAALDAWRTADEADPAAVSLFGSVQTSTLQTWLGRLCADCDLRSRGYHALRHRCGTRLYSETRDVVMVARHLGHTNLDTARIYVQLADDDYVAAVDRLMPAAPRRGGGRRRKTGAAASRPIGDNESYSARMTAPPGPGADVAEQPQAQSTGEQA